MGFWDFIFGGSGSSSSGGSRNSGSSWGTGKTNSFNPGAWREQYDRENWEYHEMVCDHDDPWDCDDDEHF